MVEQSIRRSGLSGQEAAPGPAAASDHPDWRRAIFGGRGVPLILQAEAAECGLACLAMVAGHHGRRRSLPELRQLFGASIKGTTPASAAGRARHYIRPRAASSGSRSHCSRVRRSVTRSAFRVMPLSRGRSAP
jgi:hypothetical protein